MSSSEYTYLQIYEKENNESSEGTKLKWLNGGAAKLPRVAAWIVHHKTSRIAVILSTRWMVPAELYNMAVLVDFLFFGT